MVHNQVRTQMLYTDYQWIIVMLDLSMSHTAEHTPTIQNKIP